MKKISILLGFSVLVVLIIAACNQTKTNQDNVLNQQSEMEKKVAQYLPFKLTTDVSVLTENERKMLPLLFEAAKMMDKLFWYEAFGLKDSVCAQITDESTRKFFYINYGPWDRLDDNKAFISGFGEKPEGANFYPLDMNRDEFENWNNPEKESLYTMIRRDSAGQLQAIPYHVYFKADLEKVADLLKQAAALAEDAGLKKYFELRAQALLSDDYFASDMAWMEMKTNTIDFVVGPIENYEDAMFGFKAAHEAYILIKDKEWSNRLIKYAALLSDLQKALPVDAEYKKEVPGSSSDLGAYEVVFYAGDCNAGSKTIAINLPNDERVHLAKGSRRLQLKNAMQAKFDAILSPIANVLIAEDQRKNVQFTSFFENTMFHEVAHGLGIKNTIDGKSTVGKALKEKYSTLEEGKADILGLFMVTELQKKGHLEADLMNNYVTFMAGIFRSIRFGAASDHGQANLIRFNYFKEMGAFTRNENGTYSVNFEKMQEAMNSLSALILKIQGDGDYEAAAKLVSEKAVMDEQLKADLARLTDANIPVDVVFEQGQEVLGL